MLLGCSDGGYQRKGGNWHYGETAFAPLDGASFQPIDAHFGRDLQRGYYRGSAVTGSHGASFEVLGEHEARDRAQVYYADTYRKGQEYWSIQHLRIETIDGAEAASYRVLGHGYASDARRAYFEGVSFGVPARLHALRALGHDYASDGRHVWHRGHAIEGVDAASFVLLEESAQDGQADGAAQGQVPDQAQGQAQDSPPRADARDRHGRLLHGRRVAS